MSRKVQKQFVYTAEHIAFFQQYVPHFPFKRVVEIFNHQFGTQLTAEQIKQACQKRGIKRPNNGCFKKGGVPWNKGISLPSTGRAREFHFKKGHRPHTWKPIGTERVCSKDGVVLVKVAESDQHTKNGWRYRAHLVLEQAGQTIPPNHIVVHRNGIPDDDRVENLLVIPRALSVRLAHCTRIYGVPFTAMPPDLQDTILLKAQIYAELRKHFSHQEIKNAEKSN